MVVAGLLFLILVAIVGGKSAVKGVLSLAFGGLLLMAGCAIV